MMTSLCRAADYVLTNIYGQQITGCTQTTVQTTGANRAGPLAVTSKFYVIWCELAADFSTGDACRYVVGGAAIDVTALSGSKVGKTIFAGQQEVLYVTNQNAYISTVSKTASSKLNICQLN